MKMITINKSLSIFFSILLLTTSGYADAAKDKEQVLRGKKIFKKICSFCHGSEGEGDDDAGVPRIGCHGVINKSDTFLYETISRGRKGEHELDMPTFGKGPATKIENDLRYALEGSKRFTEKQINEFIAKIIGESKEKQKKIREPGIIKKFGQLSSEDISSVIAYLRYMQTQPLPEECIAEERERFKGDVEEGRKIFMDNCRRCHGPDGKGDSFFMGKRVAPRNLTDKVYMNAVSDEYLKEVITKGGLRMGRSGIMAPFHFSGKEIADVITYVRTLSR